MNPGKLNQRITIEQYTTAKDSYGQDVETWATLATVWGEFLPKTSREFYAEQQVNAELTAMIRIRYRSDVNEKDRITHDSRMYEIFGQPVNVEMRKRWLLIKVKEIT